MPTVPKAEAEIAEDFATAQDKQETYKPVQN